MSNIINSSTINKTSKGTVPMSKTIKQDGKSMRITGVIIDGHLYEFEGKSRSKQESTCASIVAAEVEAFVAVVSGLVDEDGQHQDRLPDIMLLLPDLGIL